MLTSTLQRCSALQNRVLPKPRVPERGAFKPLGSYRLNNKAHVEWPLGKALFTYTKVRAVLQGSGKRHWKGAKTQFWFQFNSDIYFARNFRTRVEQAIFPTSKVSVQSNKPESVHVPHWSVLSKHFQGNSLEEAGGEGNGYVIYQKSFYWQNRILIFVLTGVASKLFTKPCTHCISLDIYIFYTFYNLTNNYINTSSNVRNPYLLGVYN